MAWHNMGKLNCNYCERPQIMWFKIFFLFKCCVYLSLSLSNNSLCLSLCLDFFFLISLWREPTNLNALPQFCLYDYSNSSNDLVYSLILLLKNKLVSKLSIRDLAQILKDTYKTIVLEKKSCIKCKVIKEWYWH